MPLLFVEIDNCFESAQVLAAKIDKYVRFCQRKVKDADGRERPMRRTRWWVSDGRYGDRPHPLLPLVFNRVGPRKPEHRHRTAGRADPPALARRGARRQAAHRGHASNGPSPLDFLPYRDGKPLPGGFKLGINPGLVKHEGTQTVLWGEEVRERFDAPELNLARYIKDGSVIDADNGE
ncbi:hypothetical protein S1361_00730 [Streptomyces cyanogenus]|uniref:Uncharacterized protein n=1 Tax=Streptomyces cyanogenus TaxID=80860 RepID=A0ABX7TJA8_STRCY|nr:hypothetical protein [Streptomyces cyanogenus]QTD95843.1 hypothetical protein S1361_00730 [Streptomyces cyanogenus]